MSGRPPEKDMVWLQWQINSMVEANKRSLHVSLREAQRLTAASLDVSIDTVKRARRAMHRLEADVHIGPFKHELELHISPAKHGSRIRKLKARLAEIKRSRGM
jgi:hypothetical protein